MKGRGRNGGGGKGREMKGRGGKGRGGERKRRGGEEMEEEGKGGEWREGEGRGTERRGGEGKGREGRGKKGKKSYQMPWCFVLASTPVERQFCGSSHSTSRGHRQCRDSTETCPEAHVFEHLVPSL